MRAECNDPLTISTSLLTILLPPTFHLVSSGIDSTYFKVAPAPYTSVMAGRTINLVCSINFTNPPIYYDLPALSWLSGDTALANTTTVTVLQNSKAFSYLSIRDAQPSNSLVYSCSNGTRAVTTNLTVLSKSSVLL